MIKLSDNLIKLFQTIITFMRFTITLQQQAKGVLLFLTLNVKIQKI